MNSTCAWCGCANGHEPLCLGGYTVKPPLPPVPPRETTLEAWEHMKRSGALGAQQRRVYEIVARFGPLTQFETYQKMSELDGTPALSLRSSRHSELVALGWLREVGFRQNPSGRRAIVYSAVPASELRAS